MCDILLAIFNIFLNFVAGFSGDLASTFANIGFGLLESVFGCAAPPIIG